MFGLFNSFVLSRCWLAQNLSQRKMSAENSHRYVNWTVSFQQYEIQTIKSWIFCVKFYSFPSMYLLFLEWTAPAIVFCHHVIWRGEKRRKKKKSKKKNLKKKKIIFLHFKKKIFPSFQITHLINLSKCCAHLVQSKLLEDKNITRQLWDPLAPPSKELNYLLADKAGFCVCRLYVQKGSFLFFLIVFTHMQKKKNPM